MKYSLNFKIGLVLSFATLLGLSSCDNVLPVPSINNGAGAGELTSKVIATPENVRATHGRKGVITISWTPISNAQYYFVYKANSPHDTYVQIDEVGAGSTSLDIKVPSGTSGYFKVAAVDAYEHVSDLSLAVYGTSLATPVITAIEEELDTATVYWYMENVSSESYLSTVRYNVNCYNADGSLKQTKTLSATPDTLCTFENLNSATRYYYEVETFIANAQDNVEKSFKVDSETAVNLIPKVAEFSVSEGDYTDGIELTIKLPEIGKILAEGGKGGADASSYETRPLYFQIQRREKIEGNTTNEFFTIVDYLNFKGTATSIVADGTPTANYQDGALWNDYTEGNEIRYKDTSVERGVKYEYRVLSYIDCYCLETNYKADKKVKQTHEEKKGFVKTGWAASNAKFLTTRGESIYYDETQKQSDSVKFRAEWNDFGKASNYCFLIYENHRKLMKDNGGSTDTAGSSKFVLNGTSCYFDSLDDVNEYIRKYEYLEKDPEDISDAANAPSRGYYKYTLCIVPTKVRTQTPDANTDISGIYSNAFIKVEDLSNIAITNGEGQAISVINFVESGYKNKAIINFTWQNKATYKIRRNTLTPTGEIDASVESVIYSLYQSGTTATGGAKPYTVNDGTATFTDTSLESGKSYSYSLLAANSDFEDNESMSKTVETLGTPVAIFDKTKADYNTVTITWSKVQQATSYKVKHNGKTWTVNASELEAEGEEKVFTDENGEYEVKCVNGTAYTFIIKAKAIQYFEADAKTISSLNAGKDLSVNVDAVSDKNDQTEVTLSNVTVLGPAKVDINATQGSSNYMITVDWQMIDGVTSYALRRQCPNVNDPDNPRVDVFIVSSKVNGNFEISSNGEKIDSKRMSVTVSGSRIKLYDQSCTAEDITKGYQVSQEQISWGHEYLYSVTPVNNTDDDPFDESFQVIYQNIASAVNGTAEKGCTSGYGLNVNATKSEYPDKVVITWTAPNTKNLKPQVWARAEGDTTWTSLGIHNVGTSSLEVTLGTDSCAGFDRCGKVEFAVNYEQNSKVEFKQSYLNYLANRGYKDSNGNLTGNEPDNIGYEFSLPYFVADKPIANAETFSETVNWALWNASNDDRKKMPGDFMTEDCYEIYIKNKDINATSKSTDDGWYLIATVSRDGKVTKNANLPNWANIDVSGALTTLTVTAKGVSATDGVHNGLLKVQRDYKHYYRLVGKRRNSEGGEIIETNLGYFNDTACLDPVCKAEVYTYRKISTDEFGKCVGLIAADAQHKVGGKEGTLNGVTGSYKTATKYNARVYNEFRYSYSNYKHKFTKTPGYDTEVGSGFIFNCGQGSHGSCYSSKIFGFGNNTITITHESGLPSYQGSLTFSCGVMEPWAWEHEAYWDLSFKYKNAAKEKSTSASSSKANFVKWFPFMMGSELPEGNNDGVNSSYPTMQGEWWEVKQ